MPAVKIRIEKGKEQAGDGNSSVNKAEDPSKNVAVETLFAHQMLGLGKQIISYNASNIANFTGNYIEQDKINNTLEILGDVSTVGLGFVSKGWVGGTIAIAGVVTKKVFQMVSEYRQDILSERDREYMLARSGNSTTNGSRGTEN